MDLSFVMRDEVIDEFWDGGKTTTYRQMRVRHLRRRVDAGRSPPVVSRTRTGTRISRANSGQM